jgi:hypothetical protein
MEVFMPLPGGSREHTIVKYPSGKRQEVTRTTWGFEDYAGVAFLIATIILVLGLAAGWIPPNVYTVGIGCLTAIGAAVAYVLGRKNKDAK